jgi:flagellar protein FliO/FliZ
VFALLFFSLCAFSQNLDSSNVSVVDESTVVLNSSSNENATEYESPNTFWLFTRMILVLIAIIGLIYAFVWFLRRTSSPKTKEDLYLKEVANLTLNPGKSVRVITLKDKAYIIGVTDSNINLISEVHDKDLIDAMNLYASENDNNNSKDFSTILSMFSKSTSNVEDFLKKRRERFSESEIDK